MILKFSVHKTALIRLLVKYSGKQTEGDSNIERGKMSQREIKRYRDAEKDRESQREIEKER